MRPAVGMVRLTKLTTAIAVNGLVGRGLAPNSIPWRRCRSALRTAIKLDKLARDPAERVTMPRLARVERRVLTPARAESNAPATTRR
jgi:hypothetical protein